MNTGRKRSAWRRLRIPAIAFLSFAALEVTVLVSPFLAGWEAASADARMRARYLLCRQPHEYAAPDVTLVSIGPETERVFGRYGAGQWASRRPFLDLLSFFRQHLRPSVLAFDIVFRETPGEGDSAGEPAGLMRGVAEQLARAAEKGEQALAPEVLREAGLLLAGQADLLLAQGFASVAEAGAFPALAGYHFRGGFLHAQHEDVRIPQWSDRDVFGDSAGGDEERGERIPYLRDVAIPERDVLFPSAAEASAYVCAPNATLPARGVLDYTLLGFLDGPPDEDGVVRRAPLVVGLEYGNAITRQRRRLFVPSFSLAACLLHLGLKFPLREGDVTVRFGREIVIRSPARGEYRVPIDGQGRMYLNFKARLGDFRGVPFSDLAPPADGAARRAEAAARRGRDGSVDGRVAVVAVNSAGVDAGACPIAARTPLVLVHLTAMRNILERDFVQPLRPRAAAALLGAVFLVFTAVCHVERAVRLGPAALGCIALYLVGSYAALQFAGVIVPAVAPTLYMALGSFLVLSYRYFTEELARKRIRSMFSTMVSDEVLTYLEENPESFSLRGHNVEATVFFSDIADFTPISENLPPDKLTGLLNAYLTPVTDCIMARGGYVDKYVGDSVMAVWGAPRPSADHAANACLCALEQQRILAGLNERLRAEYGAALAVRMGLNSGTVTAGTMGSEKKFQYTVVGDVVNVASRLEPANKDFKTRIIIGDATRRMAAGVVTRRLGRILVVGRQEAVTIHELVGRAGEVEGATLETVRLYEEALEAFFRRDWSGCLGMAGRILSRVADGPSLHLKRLAMHYADNPPPDDWQGEFVRTVKD